MYDSNAVINESRLSVLDELSCSAIDISASASSCRLQASIIGSRLAWTRDSPGGGTEQSDTGNAAGTRRAAVGMEIPMGIPMGMGMGWVWG